ncbi:hypothetical protein PSC71_06535 [Devosia sp. J2-20]|jgi:hypothetical protein|uniref:hypothetical protein n=1 Tax=Devosia TaxID=46913 RepID=UPI0022AFC4AE|nr:MULTISPECIES: hypothetical protein [Devosia]MCZ4347940.1 hypothetical protein [Devosia neptuniae]WDR00418.1 hypothetical protein PSC71_06535 [Devosia sp. J2-20]
MAMGNQNALRHRAIATALAAELQRQADSGSSRIDVEALASAVDDALDPGAPIAEGKRPAELNSTNDD